MVEIENSDSCNLCYECIRYCKQSGVKDMGDAISVGENDDLYIFTIESTGALQPIDIVKRSFKILKDKLDKFSADLL